jgi:hypothetical protein
VAKQLTEEELRRQAVQALSDRLGPSKTSWDAITQRAADSRNYWLTKASNELHQNRRRSSYMEMERGRLLISLWSEGAYCSSMTGDLMRPRKRPREPGFAAAGIRVHTVPGLAGTPEPNREVSRDGLGSDFRNRLNSETAECPEFSFANARFRLTRSKIKDFRNTRYDAGRHRFPERVAGGGAQIGTKSPSSRRNFKSKAIRKPDTMGFAPIDTDCRRPCP